MLQQFLYEYLDGVKKMGMELPEIPDFLVENLNPEFELRQYQKEAFGRFLHCYKHDFENKEFPLHLLFNMATGSGKTLIMAGLILYLYEQGHRNFLFFVNSTNIIEKTKDNFLNKLSSKYLFNKNIFFSNKGVRIKQVNNFDGVSGQDINICFTTIQKLHGDLHNEKENSITIEDFKKKKIVMISDEAHHTQVSTRSRRQGKLLEEANWENTVEKIFKQNDQNLLLEFTATLLEGAPQDLIDKYRDKIIYRYDLKEFRNDGYSKDVELFSSDTNKKDRILQAIILSLYRQKVAAKYGINLKPVILFKAQRTIEQSKDNKELFHKIINQLSVQDIKRIRKQTNVEILQKAFVFFKDNNISDSVLLRELKDGFAQNYCLSVNEEREKEEHQLMLNSLEDKNNQIRAIFAVQKLNEGWDVLNLFDIVRLYETRDTRNNLPGQTTISEAQLIGRGARYFPFAISNEDKYIRKFDEGLTNELRVLEELHYHCHPGRQSRYISEIKNALIKEGMMDETEEERKLILKEEFKQKKLYKSGVIWANKRIKTNYDKVESINDLGITGHSIPYHIHSGAGRITTVFDGKTNDTASVVADAQRAVKVKDIESHIVRNALAQNEFYSFDNLRIFFPHLQSISEFIAKKEYLADLEIIFEGAKTDIGSFSNENKFLAVLKLLNEIENQIKTNQTEFQGSDEFFPNPIKEIFIAKTIKVLRNSERADGQESLVRDKDWYVFNANYGTSEEKDFVEFISREEPELRKKFNEFYLIRNERQLKIYNFKDGRAFEPDFLLFGIDKQGKSVTYQLFIEPKGPHLKEGDKWKEDLLIEISEQFKGKELAFGRNDKYRVIGLPFYSSGQENEFKRELFDSVLSKSMKAGMDK